MLAALSRHNERALLPLDRYEVHVRMLLSHADGKTPLTTADFNMQRMVISEQRPPFAALFLRLKRHYIRAGRKANIKIFLFAHSHASNSPFSCLFFSLFIISCVRTLGKQN